MKNIFYIQIILSAMLLISLSSTASQSQQEIKGVKIGDTPDQVVSRLQQIGFYHRSSRTRSDGMQIGRHRITFPRNLEGTYLATGSNSRQSRALGYEENIKVYFTAPPIRKASFIIYRVRFFNENPPTFQGFMEQMQKRFGKKLVVDRICFRRRHNSCRREGIWLIQSPSSGPCLKLARQTHVSSIRNYYNNYKRIGGQIDQLISSCGLLQYLTIKRNRHDKSRIASYTLRLFDTSIALKAGQELGLFLNKYVDDYISEKDSKPTVNLPKF